MHLISNKFCKFSEEVRALLGRWMSPALLKSRSTEASLGRHPNTFLSSLVKEFCSMLDQCSDIESAVTGKNMKPRNWDQTLCVCVVASVYLESKSRNEILGCFEGVGCVISIISSDSRCCSISSLQFCRQNFLLKLKNRLFDRVMLSFLVGSQSVAKMCFGDDLTYSKRFSSEFRRASLMWLQHTSSVKSIQCEHVVRHLLPLDCRARAKRTVEKIPVANAS